MIDLHLHSTASDGIVPPTEVVRRAAGLALEAIALTDHDTLDGVSEALIAGEQFQIRVIGGCEFSVEAPWGEMHLLGYFLPPGHDELEQFTGQCRADRYRRAEAMVRALGHLGIALDFDQVVHESKTEALGRPHIARALVGCGAVDSVDRAFQVYLGKGRPAFIPKRLPGVATVTEIVHRAGGVTVAAHLGMRATKAALVHLKGRGLDGVEAAHPSHSPEVRSRICRLAGAVGLMLSGGSDWHGDGDAGGPHAEMGSQEVPLEWLVVLEEARTALTGGHR